MNSNYRAKIRVKGKVQGVWFRAFTREKATELGVTGWVQNETGGAVYLEANGEKSKLDLFIDKLKQGPENGSRLGTIGHILIFVIDLRI